MPSGFQAPSYTRAPEPGRLHTTGVVARFVSILRSFAIGCGSRLSHWTNIMNERRNQLPPHYSQGETAMENQEMYQLCNPTSENIPKKLQAEEIAMTLQKLLCDQSKILNFWILVAKEIDELNAAILAQRAA
jgi:hypothetical protein